MPIVPSLRARRASVLALALALAACGGSNANVAAEGPAPLDDGAIASSPDASSPGASADDAAAPIDGARAGGDASTDGGPRGPFAHPGVLVTAPQLAFVKQKIAAGAEPWTTALAKAKASKWGALPYTPHPLATVECGSFSNPDIGCTDEKNDAMAAYTDALVWALTGDEAYAKQGIAILDAWSSTIQAHTNSNAPLQSAWVASVLPRAGEILKHAYGAWPAAAADRFAAMLRKVYLPEVIHGAPSTNGNWELSMAEATIAIGVHLDDRATFDAGVALWRGRVPAYVYLASDGPTPVPPPNGGKSGAALIQYWYGQSKLVDGVSQETCRDLGHVQYGFAAMIDAAETARIQGVDLYAEQAKRITAGLEFHAQLLGGAAVPSFLCNGALNAVTPDPMWEIARNEYATRDGMPLPNTSALVAKIRPTGADHHMVFETLTHAEVGAVGLP